MGSLLRFQDKISEHMLKTLQVTSTQNFKTMPSSGKLMASAFWDFEGVIMINYLQKGHIINGAYYASELCNLVEEIKSMHRGKL